MLAPCILLVLATAGPAIGQGESDTTRRTITIPAPQNGIIYIRSGRPRGVRIRSRDIPERLRRAREARARVDLERLTRIFDRQGLGLYAERAQADGVDVFILRDSASGQPADTLSVAEAIELVESFGAAMESDEADESAGGRVDTGLVAVIERSMFDIGLFRTLQVNFEFDRSDLLTSSLPTLEAVAEVLRRHHALRVEVAGHTDSVGAEAYNQALSRRRAEQVAGYLVELGIDPGRLHAAGYGERRPLLSNATATGRALNRRVEFSVLDGSPVDTDVREE